MPHKCHCYLSLVLKAVHIDFNAVEGPAYAKFCLGSDWANDHLKKVVYSANGGSNHCLHDLRVDCHGHFKFEIPLETEELHVTVFIFDCDRCPLDKKAKKGFKVKGYFLPYEMTQLVCRSYTGVGNCLSHPEWGSVGQNLKRQEPRSLPRNSTRNLTRDAGATGLAERGPLNPSPRVISNAICKQTASVPNDRDLSDMVWAWGQFLDHEIDLTPDDSGEAANMTTSSGDPNEDYPDRTIPFNRSRYNLDSDNCRQQPNAISAFIDGTNTYGFDPERAYALRRLDGSGKLKTATGPDGDLMMNNAIGLTNANPTGVDPEDQFLSGDIRANETLTLIALHTLFAREHNRQCDQVLTENPSWSGQDELIYQEARRRVSAIMQVITYEEFLPALLGSQNLGAYTGYDATVNPGINNEFSTAGYRLGHSMLSDNLRTVTSGGATGAVGLRDSFFRPDWIRTNGIADLLVGSSQQLMQEIDHQVVDGVRNFLFGPPTVEQLLDLASLNIQRGRDHQLPGYNTVRANYDLAPRTTWAAVTSNTTLQTKLAELYGTDGEDGPDYLDPWLGGLLEDHLPGSSVGELIAAILRDQFDRLRTGDRFWYQNDPAITPALRQTIQDTRLADVIRRNTGRTDVADDVFRV